MPRQSEVEDSGVVATLNKDVWPTQKCTERLKAKIKIASTSEVSRPARGILLEAQPKKKKFLVNNFLSKSNLGNLLEYSYS